MGPRTIEYSAVHAIAYKNFVEAKFYRLHLTTRLYNPNPTSNAWKPEVMKNQGSIYNLSSLEPLERQRPEGVSIVHSLCL